MNNLSVQGPIAAAGDPPTAIPGLVIRRRFEHKDSRGTFGRLLDPQEFTGLGWPSITAQVNFSRTDRRGTIRGMHAQTSEIPEFKLLACVRGAVWDVCVDMRRGSPTFLQWRAVELSEGNALSILIPPGVAHGFQTLSNDVDLVYCHSAPYDRDSEIGVNPFDPAFAISWPLPVTVMSDRDRNHEFLASGFQGLLA